MKKRFIDLQLFAEESNDSATQASSATATADPEKATEKEPAPVVTPKQPSEEKKYTDSDVNSLLGQKFAEWQKKKDREIDEAKKLAEMDGKQRAEYERDQAIKERDEAKKQLALVDMTNTAQKILKNNGISVSDELLQMLVTSDAETTKAACDSFSKAFNEAVENRVREAEVARATGTTPKMISHSGNVMSEIEKRIQKYQ